MIKRIALAAVIAVVFGALGFIIFRMERQFSRLRSEIKDVREETLSALFADKVDQIVAGAETDQEKCLAVARWVAGHISNSKNPKGDSLTWFSQRAGLCGERSQIFVQMLLRLNIPAREFQIHEFNHSCAQAFYDGEWHFFDVTYAGVFMRDGKVLSWEGIRSDPEAAVAGMVVFEQTIDRSTADDNYLSPRVDNNVRMSLVYTAERIKSANTYGFLRDPEPKIIPLGIDCSGLNHTPLVFGQKNNSSEDIAEDARHHGALFSYIRYLGTVEDTFSVKWQFQNATPGASYKIKFLIREESHPDLKFVAVPEGCKVLSNAEYVTSGEKETEWELEMKAEASEFSVLIRYDFRTPGRGLLLDQITISRTKE